MIIINIKHLFLCRRADIQKQTNKQTNKQADKQKQTSGQTKILQIKICLQNISYSKSEKSAKKMN